MDEITKLQAIIIKANDEWEGITHDEGDFKREYLEDYCKEAYLTLLTILDKHQLIGLRDYCLTEWKKYEKDLIKSAYSDVADMGYLAITGDFLYPVMSAIANVYGSSQLSIIGENKKFPLEQAIELLAHSALKLNFKVIDEASLDKLIEAFLTPIFPDLNSNPSLTLAESYRQPDSSIPSLKLLLEYKFIKNRTEIRKVIDEAQADIRNYAKSPWECLYIIIGMTEAFITKDKIEMSLLEEPTSFKKISISLIKF